MAHETLRDGFWPHFQIAKEMEDQYMDDNQMREEFVEDAHFVGHKHDRLAPSFRVGYDVCVDYFVVVHLANGDFHPF